MLPRKEVNLPPERVCSEYPFETTVLDFVGQLNMKDIYVKSSIKYLVTIVTLA